MDVISSALISKALDGLSMRQLFTAQNIANANTQGYRALEVTFEESLRIAARDGVDAISQVTPKVQQKPTNGISENLRLDMELATASQTAMRYGALIELLGRQKAMLRTVINGGR